VPGGRLRLKLPSESVFTFAIGAPVRLAAVNAYTSPEAGLSLPGAGPPASCNVPVTAPSPDAVDELPRGLDEEHAAEQTSSRVSPSKTHAAFSRMLVIVLRPRLGSAC
jgi:hypothetical protein